MFWFSLQVLLGADISFPGTTVYEQQEWISHVLELNYSMHESHTKALNFSEFLIHPVRLIEIQEMG